MNKELHFYYESKKMKYPCFELTYRDWDDYGNKTTFKLYYNHNKNNYDYIGQVKITNGSNVKTFEVLPKEFSVLSEKFCSLGLWEEYYINIKNLFPDDYESILWALRDAAYFTEIYDQFSQNHIFYNSLLRSDSAEQLTRHVRFILEGRSLEDKYQFIYNFYPNYSEASVDIDFHFNNNDMSFDRVFAVIGENGTGKTQLITSLPIDLSERRENNFKPDVPIFGKIIAVSYSIFDEFQRPNSTPNFNYVYCGLLDENKELLSIEDKKERLIHDYDDKIRRHSRTDKWRRILLSFIDNDIIDTIFQKTEQFHPEEDEYKLDIKSFKQMFNILSSGQSIMLEIITRIVANIRLDSLILFDEPETHLHPTAISELISTIYELVEEFDSYCLITTHSPIIIQNIFGKNVYVLEKEDNYPSLRKIGVESFGENLTILTENVFANSSVEKHYKVVLDKLIERFGDYETIVQTIEKNGLPLSLNTKLYLKSKL